LLFGRSAVSPFSPSRVTARADKAWTEAGLERVTLHEARHCYASYAITAGVNLKALSTFMGHARIAITLDLYATCFRAVKMRPLGCWTPTSRSPDDDPTGTPTDTPPSSGRLQRGFAQKIQF
jgi:hypothetical protein